MYSASGESFGYLFRRAFRHDGSSGIAGAGAHVNDVVRFRHDFRVMFNDDDGVSLVRQTVQHVNEQPYVPRMQADGGFFNQVQVSGQFPAFHQGVPADAPALDEFRHQLEPLGLPAGKRVGGLPQRQIAQAGFRQQFEGIRDAGLAFKNSAASAKSI